MSKRVFKAEYEQEFRGIKKVVKGICIPKIPEIWLKKIHFSKNFARLRLAFLCI